MTQQPIRNNFPENRRRYISFTGYTAMAEGRDVYEAALDRIRHLFTLSKTYVVCFSGGKDSTCVLMLSLQVARELGRLPLEVCYVDEEMIDPDTIAYATELREWDELDFKWFCTPIKHTLRAHGRHFWTTWDPEQEHVWVREKPAWAISDFPGFVYHPENSYDDIIDQYWSGYLKRPDFVVAAGIRVKESLNRQRQLMIAGHYYFPRRHGQQYAKPIYDWSTEDVWKAISKNNWPHSRFYDQLWLAGIGRHSQRVHPWGNVSSSRENHVYPEFYPDMWDKALKRLPELAVSARYGNTKLLRDVLNRPAGWTWQQYCFHLLDQLNESSRKRWLNHIDVTLKRWARKSTLPFPEDLEKDAGPTWKKLCAVIGKNDSMNGGSRDNT